MKSLLIHTPFTQLKVNCLDDAVFSVDFVEDEYASVMAVSGILQEVKDQILQYCHSADFQFDLALSPQGTDFQQRVWQCLIAIPAGQVRTYGDIAAELGSSPRAVGNACRANPVPLIIPCHRVVSRAGIGGFAGDVSGGKVKLKQQLLHHEGVEI